PSLLPTYLPYTTLFRSVAATPSTVPFTISFAIARSILAITSTRQSRRFAATNLALLAAARSARIAPFYSGTTKDCDSLWGRPMRSEEHTSELQSPDQLV